jgi:dTDP-4-amino-4,6-dideoxygalactose transaminase
VIVPWPRAPLPSSLSLPLHPRLHARQTARVIDAIQAFEKGSIDA